MFSDVAEMNTVTEQMLFVRQTVPHARCSNRESSVADNRATIREQLYTASKQAHEHLSGKQLMASNYCPDTYRIVYILVT